MTPARTSRPIIESFEKIKENTKKSAQGPMHMAGASRTWKFVKSILLREYDVDLLGAAPDF